MFYPKKKSWQGLTLTNSAINKIQRLLKSDPSMLGLRLKIKHSGCAGLSYVIEKVTHSENNDWVCDYNGAKLYVSIAIMPIVDGTEVDYVQEGLTQMFKFKNPQAQHFCGCGESFSI